MKNRDIILPILVAVFMGIGNVFVAQLTKQANPLLVTICASVLATVFFLPLVKIFKYKIQINQILKFKKEFLSIVILRPLIGALLLNYGFSLTTATNGLLLLRLEPIFILFMSSIFLKEKIKMRQIILTLLIVSGAALLITGSAVLSSINIGDVFVILSVAFFSYTYFPIKKVTEKIDPILATIITTFISAVLLLPLLFFVPPAPIISSYTNSLLLLGNVVFVYVVGIILFYISLKRIRPWIVSSLLSIMPLAGGIVAYFWLGETLNSIQLTGGAIILIGSYFISKEK